MTLGQLRANCQDFGQAFGLSTVEIVLLILVLLVGCSGSWPRGNARTRMQRRPSATRSRARSTAAIGMFAGSGFGLVVAEVVPPDLLGTIFGLVGLVALFFAIRGAAKGDGETGGRVAAVVLGALLAALGVTLAIFAYAVPNSGPAGDEYQTYVNVVAISLGLLGGARRHRRRAAPRSALGRRLGARLPQQLVGIPRQHPRPRHAPRLLSLLEGRR
jgi:hypothetical protein